MGRLLRALLVRVIRVVRRSKATTLLSLAIFAFAVFGLPQAYERVQDWPSAMARFEDRNAEAQPARTVPRDVPWSQVIAGSHFQRATSVLIDHSGRITMGGYSLSLEGAPISSALIVPASLAGEVRPTRRLAQSSTSDITDVVVSSHDRAFLMVWNGTTLEVSKVSGNGDVYWTRRFETRSRDAWGRLKALDDGGALVALAGRFDAGEVRLHRLDRDGRVLYRSRFGVSAGRVSDVLMGDGGDGGAVVALAGMNGALPMIRIARFDRWGRERWRRDLDTPGSVYLADLQMTRDGMLMLLSGAEAKLMKFDTLGTPVWARDLPALAVDGRHLVARGREGAIAVLGEALGPAGQSHLWLARFDVRGKPVWEQRRANRLNAQFEAVTMADDNTLIVAGSLSDPGDGNSDMLLMAIGRDGAFPAGFAASELETPDVDEPVSYATLASFVDARGSRPALVPPEEDTASDAGETTMRPDAALELVPDTGPVASAVMADMENPAVPVPFREVAATDAASVITPALRDSAPTADAAPSVQAAPTPEAMPASFRYRCTFTCKARSEDLVKYPVTREIAEVSEGDADRFALDAMAMDNGVCLASGGLLFDAPRQPPVCERIE